MGDGAIAGARLAGASTVIAVDVDDRKLEWAKGFGATHTINSNLYVGYNVGSGGTYAWVCESASFCHGNLACLRRHGRF